MVAFRFVLPRGHSALSVICAKPDVLFPGLGFSCLSRLFFFKSEVFEIELYTASGDLDMVWSFTCSLRLFHLVLSFYEPILSVLVFKVTDEQGTDSV